ncbi:HAD family hydrolase [Veillonella rodentium]|uniref:HAD phosphoserine phosphatase-like hydrolase, family IB n=1 Tax=Veillonella rodentium TaxID=248315 RepID=A0A239Z3Z8_9FIRM|nr:HAD family hydrolase [Veillonella rodentium]SNV65254.1 HAD phosphoserine phosphatase-like hydrolase, family IB [Veillonella rodentium]
MITRERTEEQQENNSKPVLAICYDFDKTLTPDDMQAQGYIQSLDIDVDAFWKESNGLDKQHDMDNNLAYMYMMATKSYGKQFLTKELLAAYGAKVKLYDGVRTWFERIRQYGAEKGVCIEHYIISSGLKEMIEGTEMAKEGAFTKIYASAFLFDDKGVATWPAQAINYTNKTQFLFRIQKGVLDINDPRVNDYLKPEEQRVPFRNMIYIGDSDTDIPCMSLVNANGGHSIGVYDPEVQNKDKVYKMMRHHRIRYYAPADYSESSHLDTIVRQIIDKTAAYEALERQYVKDKQEAEKSY